MSRVFLFNNDHPEGKIFDQKQVEAMVKKGWVDSPSELDIEKPKTTFTKEQVEEAHTDDILGMVRSMGFKVLTDIELTAEIAKAVEAQSAPALTLADFSDAELIAEAEKRGLKESGEEDTPLTLEEMQTVFDEEPEELNKDELVILANQKYKLGLNSRMKEATLIEKITEKMNAE